MAAPFISSRLPWIKARSLRKRQFRSSIMIRRKRLPRACSRKSIRFIRPRSHGLPPAGTASITIASFAAMRRLSLSPCGSLSRRGSRSDRPAPSFNDLIAREPLGNFGGRSLRPVRSMRRVLANRKGEFFADGAGLGFCGIRCAEHVAVARDGILALEHLHHHRPRSDRADKILEKRALPMNGVKNLRLLARHLDPFLRNDAQARLFDHGIDEASDVAPRCIGLEN